MAVDQEIPEAQNPEGEQPTEQLAPPVNENFKWYIIHAYSGFERKVRESLESRIMALAGMLAGSVATAKAEKEAKRLVKLFAKASRAIEDNPAHVHEAVRQRADVPPRDLEEFRRLLDLR